MKTIHNLIQGTTPWHQFRLDHDGASEVAAVLGLSLKVKRTELLRMKKTGIAKEFSDWVQQNVLDYGHEVEGLARPLVEAIIGEDLSPVTCSDGRQSASCDGLTIDDRIAFEHKQWSEAMAAHIRATGTVPPEHMPQCQQVLKVTGADKLIFVISDGTADNLLYVWVLLDPAWFARIDAGWAQFHADLAEYVPAEAVTPVTAAPVESLPAVSVRMNGTLAVVSNLDVFGVKLRAFVDKIDMKPSTDQAFADAEAAVKTLGNAEDALEQAEAAALAQTASVEEMRRTVADYVNLARTTRLLLEKVVKTRKDQIRVELVQEGQKALAEHVVALDTRLGKRYMPEIPADFAGAIKGKRTIDSLRDAVSTTLANSKIAASAIADRIQTNLATLTELASNHKFLFADTAALVLKANDDLTAVVQSRIAAHEKAEADKLEAQRESIRAEELARIEREQAQAKRQADDKAAPAQAATVTVAIAVAPVAPAPTVIAMVPRTATPSTSAPTLRLGQIGERLGFDLRADFLRSLGFEPAATDKAAKLYHERDFTFICAALLDHIQGVQATQAA